ncbi:hypothetical protein BJ508DRAFT_336787 [Ascobolus immersus RN42]|uniref:Uncharacterized protein n=1 Tax=Ascobolus immersus RN42 TaxID=1160509 RepID=A0A3N4H7E7_ASCIM|nr:hypothetical protein BJ508DRAFT_336787 [Ascobolus immersus RN42]
MMSNDEHSWTEKAFEHSADELKTDSASELSGNEVEDWIDKCVLLIDEAMADAVLSTALSHTVQEYDATEEEVLEDVELRNWMNQQRSHRQNIYSAEGDGNESPHTKTGHERNHTIYTSRHVTYEDEEQEPLSGAAARLDMTEAIGSIDSANDADMNQLKDLLNTAWILTNVEWRSATTIVKFKTIFNELPTITLPYSFPSDILHLIKNIAVILMEHYNGTFYKGKKSFENPDTNAPLPPDPDHPAEPEDGGEVGNQGSVPAAANELDK